MPLPPVDDAKAINAWIEARLSADGDSDPMWRSRLLGRDPSKVIGSADPYRYIVFKAERDFAVLLSQVGREVGLSREGLIRVVLAHYVAQVRGLDPDDVLGRMPPRASSRLPTGRPTGRPRKQR